MTIETRFEPGNFMPIAMVNSVEWVPDKGVLRVVAEVSRSDKHLNMVAPMVGQHIGLLPTSVPTK